MFGNSELGECLFSDNTVTSPTSVVAVINPSEFVPVPTTIEWAAPDSHSHQQQHCDYDKPPLPNEVAGNEVEPATTRSFHHTTSAAMSAAHDNKLQYTLSANATTWTPRQRRGNEAYEPDGLQQLIEMAAERFRNASSWKQHVTESRGDKGDFNDEVQHLQHPAAHLLNRLRITGAPVCLLEAPWEADRIRSALEQGPHKSAKEHIDFLRDEFVGMIKEGHWTVLPAHLVASERWLRLSPLGVVPQRERRPRTICDYTYFGINPQTLPLAPQEAMQFGRALQRLLQRMLLHTATHDADRSSFPKLT